LWWIPKTSWVAESWDRVPPMQEARPCSRAAGPVRGGSRQPACQCAPEADKHERWLGRPRACILCVLASPEELMRLMMPQGGFAFPCRRLRWTPVLGPPAKLWFCGSGERGNDQAHEDEGEANEAQCGAQGDGGHGGHARARQWGTSKLLMFGRGTMDGPIPCRVPGSPCLDPSPVRPAAGPPSASGRLPPTPSNGGCLVETQGRRDMRTEPLRLRASVGGTRPHARGNVPRSVRLAFGAL